jgi:adenylate cyclase class 1
MINSQEMTILGRKLYAAFERKAGKIEWINPGIAPNLTEEHLTFFQLNNPQDDQPQWVVSNEAANNRDIDSNPVLKRADELSTLLAWCHFNSLLDNSTRLAVIEGEHNVTEIELNKTARSLQQYLPVAKQYSEEGEEKHQRFNQAMHPTHVLLLVNVGVDPLAHIRSKGIERLSARTDSLGYSGLRENLVLNLEQVVVNSWGELSSKRYDGDNALLHCLCDYLQMVLPAKNVPLPKIDIQCFCPTRAKAIASRVKELLNDITNCYNASENALNSRYIIEIQRQFYMLQLHEQHVHFEHANQHIDLLKLLEQPQDKHSPIVLDRYCLQQSTLQAIVPLAKADIIQVFYQQRENGLAKKADIYVLDERDSLFSFSTPIHTIKTLLTPLDQFIQSVLFRQSSESAYQDNIADNDFDFHNRDIEYFEITDKNGSKHANQHPIITELENSHFFNVQAIGHRNTNNEIVFDIFCDQQEFLSNELGPELIASAAKYILSKRNSNERYPCYITDLDLSRCIDDTAGQSIQTIQYLRHKHQLEKQLNRALENI